MTSPLTQKKLIKMILTPTKTKRILFFLISDLIFFFISLVAATLLRFEFVPPQWVMSNFIIWYPILSSVKILFMVLFRVYSFNWSFVGINDFYSILRALILACITVFALDVYLQKTTVGYSIPRSIILMDTIISSILIMSLRILKRLYREILSNDTSNGKKTIIIGAGSTGERIARELVRNNTLGYNPVAFLDDNPHKRGTFLQGIKVIGTTEEIKEAVLKTKANFAIIAVAQISHTWIKNIYAELKANGIEQIKIVPSITKMPNKLFDIKSLRDINLEDLMSRREIFIEEDSLAHFLSYKKIMVTGAAGSIGSEIVRQLIKFKPDTIFALEIDETELHDLTLEITKEIDNGTKFVPLLSDIRNKTKIDKIIAKYKPDVLFHAAAYKHVPLIEIFPDEAVSTNAIGTQNLTESAAKHDVSVFVNISTDKAVNPTSLMGATKKLAEFICLKQNSISNTKFVSVRFGNVLGSRGSVLTIFQNQIKNGGPITITHPDMERFFMSIPEAVLLVFQAASMGHGGEVFMLDMGKPKKILHLAEELITLQGFTPYQDIDIQFTGLRPGEKLYEELIGEGESVIDTHHEKVFKVKDIDMHKLTELDNVIAKLKKTVEEVDIGELNSVIRSFITFYK